jgi:hypothetical protein
MSSKTEIRVVDQKYFSEHKNGVDFDQNTSDYTTHLKCGIGERIKAQITIQVGAYAQLRDYTVQFYDTNTRCRIVMNGGGFTKAFSAGDDVRYNFSDGALATGAVMKVTAVTDDKMDFDVVTLLSGGGGGNNSAAFPTYDKGWITNITDLEGLEYKFGLIENDESTNYISKLTNIEEFYRVSDVETTPGLNSVSGVYAGNNKAAKAGKMNVKYVGLVADNNLLLPLLSWKEYIISHVFDVLPLYRDGDNGALEGTEVPPDDIYNGSFSLKYVFQSSFMRTITDVNSKLVGKWDTTNGSVGYFNESFNSFPSSYSTGAVSYFDEDISNSTDKLNVASTVKVSCSVFDSSNSFVAGDAVVVWHSAILDSTEYFKSELDNNTLWTTQTIRSTLDAAATSNDFIKDFTATVVNTGQIDLEFDIDFNATQQGRLEEGQNYILAVVCEKNGKTTDNGGKTTLLLDYNVYDKSSDIDGLFTLHRLEQFDHANTWIDSDTSTGTTNAKVDVEEAMMTFSEFSLNLADSAVLTGLGLEIITYNTVTGDLGVLETIPISLSDQILSNGVQQITLDDTRGFKLKEGNQFNLLQLRTADRIVDDQYYEINVGWRMPWQKWLEYFDADPIFYDSTEPLKGLNRFAAQYSKDSNPTTPNGDPNDYVLRVRVIADVDKDGITTRYNGNSEDIGVWGYDEDDQPPVPPTYECAITTHDEQGAEIVGSQGSLVFTSDFVEVRATYTPEVAPVFSESIDFTEVATLWNKFAHGNRYTAVSPGQRLGVWANEQANDTDTFEDAVTTFVKSDLTLYTSSPTSILADQNCNAFYGCFSLDDYETYTATGKMFSTDNDNDVIA